LRDLSHAAAAMRSPSDWLPPLDGGLRERCCLRRSEGERREAAAAAWPW
jgi:hypothetical protein